jgi:hypothetical protein
MNCIYAESYSLASGRRPIKPDIRPCLAVIILSKVLRKSLRMQILEAEKKKLLDLQTKLDVTVCTSLVKTQ